MDSNNVESKFVVSRCSDDKNENGNSIDQIVSCITITISSSDVS